MELTQPVAHVLATYPLVLNGSPLARTCAWCGVEFTWRPPLTKKAWLGGYGEPQRLCSRACNATRVAKEAAAKRAAAKERRCIGCHKSFPREAFYEGKDGRWGRYCHECGAKKDGSFRSAPGRYLSAALERAKFRAAKAGRPYELSMEWLQERLAVQQWLCHYTGRRMTTISGEGRLPENLSIDRVDNAGGYTKDNVVLCCVDVNIAKQWYPISHLVEIANMVTLWGGARMVAQPSTEVAQ